MSNHRLERLAELIKIEVSDILRREVSDPRIGFVSIVDVKVAPDIKNACLRISILGDQHSKEKSIDGLRSAAGFIRSRLGDRLEMRDVPQLYFVKDETIEKAAQVFAIMNTLKREKKSANKSRTGKASCKNKTKKPSRP